MKESYFEGRDDAPDFNEDFSGEEVGRITKMKIARMELTENGPTVLSESIASLKASFKKKSSEKVTSIDDLNKLINSFRK